jgi:hypothetical protein
MFPAHPLTNEKLQPVRIQRYRLLVMLPRLICIRHPSAKSKEKINHSPASFFQAMLGPISIPTCAEELLKLLAAAMAQIRPKTSTPWKLRNSAFALARLCFLPIYSRETVPRRPELIRISSPDLRVAVCGQVKGGMTESGFGGLKIFFFFFFFFFTYGGLRPGSPTPRMTTETPTLKSSRPLLGKTWSRIVIRST